MSELARRCRLYLQQGPPSHMSDYVPGSLTEIVIAHGAQGRNLDAELRELGALILADTDSLNAAADAAIRAYLRQGRQLVGEVLELYGGAD